MGKYRSNGGEVADTTWESVVSSGSVDRSNESREQDGTWYIRRFPDEVQ